jgi:hypothetical protein
MKMIFGFVLVLLSVLSVYSQTEDIKSTNVTVYNNNLGVVKQTRVVDVPKGISDVKITGVAQYIDPTSVHIKLDGTVLEQNYQYDLVSMSKILQKYIDKEIELFSEKELYSGKLLSVNNSELVIEKKEGGLLMLKFNDLLRISVKSLPEGLITRPTLIWKVNSEKAGKQNIDLSYHTSGMDWHAEYIAVLNENDTKMDFSSWVSVQNNSGTTFKNSKLKLIAGEVNRVNDYMSRSGVKVESFMMMDKSASFEERELFEYHLYELPRLTDLANNEIKQISLFENKTVNVKKKFVLNAYDYSPDLKVNVQLEFLNNKENNLEIPLPAGKVRVNKADGKSLEFIGEDLIKHTPKNEKVTLNIGNAFDIKAESIVKNESRITDYVMDRTFEITIRNQKNEDITIEVIKELGTNWEILESSEKYEKTDAYKIKYLLPVKKNGTNKITLVVRYNHG